MCISDWSSDVCSSDLPEVAELVDDEGEPPSAGILDHVPDQAGLAGPEEAGDDGRGDLGGSGGGLRHAGLRDTGYGSGSGERPNCTRGVAGETPRSCHTPGWNGRRPAAGLLARGSRLRVAFPRSEEHTSELQSLMRISYAVFCLKKKKPQHHKPKHED